MVKDCAQAVSFAVAKTHIKATESRQMNRIICSLPLQLEKLLTVAHFLSILLLATPFPKRPIASQRE
jgi:hypothetical protein